LPWPAVFHGGCAGCVPGGNRRRTGSLQVGNEVLSAIIGSGSGKENSSLSMLLMVETLNSVHP